MRIFILCIIIAACSKQDPFESKYKILKSGKNLDQLWFNEDFKRNVNDSILYHFNYEFANNLETFNWQIPTKDQWLVHLRNLKFNEYRPNKFLVNESDLIKANINLKGFKIGKRLIANNSMAVYMTSTDTMINNNIRLFGIHFYKKNKDSLIIEPTLSKKSHGLLLRLTK